MTNSQGHHYDEKCGDIPVIPLGLGAGQLEGKDGEISATSGFFFWVPMVTAVFTAMGACSAWSSSCSAAKSSGVATPEPGLLF